VKVVLCLISTLQDFLTALNRPRFCGLADGSCHFVLEACASADGIATRFNCHMTGVEGLVVEAGVLIGQYYVLVCFKTVLILETDAPSNRSDFDHVRFGGSPDHFQLCVLFINAVVL